MTLGRRASRPFCAAVLLSVGRAVATQCRLCLRAASFKSTPCHSTACELSHSEWLGVAVALGSLFSLLLLPFLFNFYHIFSCCFSNSDQPACSLPFSVLTPVRESLMVPVTAVPLGQRHGMRAGHFDMLAAVSMPFPTSLTIVNTSLERCFICSLWFCVIHTLLLPWKLITEDKHFPHLPHLFAHSLSVAM